MSTELVATEVGRFDGFEDREIESLDKLLEIRDVRLDFALNHHVNTRGERMDFEHYAHIKLLYNTTAPEVTLMGSVQSMKAQPLNALVHTPGRWKQMGELSVGDRVSTPDGQGAKIAAIQPQGLIPIYRIKWSDGREARACEDHLWQVRGSHQVWGDFCGLYHDFPKSSEVLSTREIAQRMSKGERFATPLPEPVEKLAKDTPLDPYFIGLILGAGRLDEGRLLIEPWAMHIELLDVVNEAVACFGLELKQRKDHTPYYFVQRADSSNDQGHEQLVKAFGELDLFLTEDYPLLVPQAIQTGSVAQRLAVLQGLLDATTKWGSLVSVTVKSSILASCIRTLVWSLGGGCVKILRETEYITSEATQLKAGPPIFTLRISHPEPKTLFRLERHRDKVLGSQFQGYVSGPVIESITFSESAEAQCIILDNEEHLYITDDYVVTHNSEWSVIDHFAAAYCGLSIFFVLPKFEMRTTYVQNRVNRCVQSVPHYKKIIGNGFFDSVALKSFGRGVVKYVGSNVLSDFKEFPADMMVVEEVDQCSKENVEFALDRLRASKYQFKRYLGNPTVQGEGIHMYYLRSNQQEWNAPCLQCGEFHELDWFKTVVAEVVDKSGNIVDYRLLDEGWKVGSRRDINCICPSCGGVLDRASSLGKWVAQHPKNSMEGFHISMLCSTLNSVSGMYNRFRRALNDPGLYKQFFNSDLGLPYSAAGNRVTETVLDRCIDPNYEFQMRPDRAHVSEDRCDGPCSMGVDVGNNLDVRISKIEIRGVRRMVFVGKIRSHNVAELHELIDRYNVEKVVIDARPELMLAQDFQEAAQCDVWLCNYGSEGGERRRTFNLNERMVRIDRTEALDRAYAQIRTKKVTLPRNYRNILGGEFTDEICLPVRQITEDSKGNARYEWTKGKDHQRHADTYDMLAAEFLRDAVLDDIMVG